MKRWQKTIVALYWLATPMIVAGVAQIVSGLPFTLTNGTVADATQVMADFNQIVNNVNANGAKNGVNSDITALTALSTPLTVTQGGTGLATLTSTGILYGNGTGTVGSSRCTMDANPIIACSSAVTFMPQFYMTNTTADTAPPTIILSKNRSSGNSGNSDQLGSVVFRGFSNSSAQQAAQLNCAQNGAAVGSNVPSLCSVLTSTTAGQLNIAFTFPPTSGTSGQMLTANGSGVTSWISATPTVCTIKTTAAVTCSGGQANANNGTYTPTAGMARIRVRVSAGGAGGGGLSANQGTAGNTTTFGTWTALGGTGGGTTPGFAGGAGGTGGANGTGTLVFRVDGGDGQSGGASATAGVDSSGGPGGTNPFGGSGRGSLGAAGQPGKANTGAGGGGANNGSATNASGGGGAGEYVEFWMTAAQVGASLTYTIGTGGAGGAAGTLKGGDGAAGVAVIEEFYW